MEKSKRNHKSKRIETQNQNPDKTNELKPKEINENLSKKNAKTKITARPGDPLPMHTAIIDRYFSNGFNGTQAVLSLFPDKDYSQAQNIAHLILRSKKNKPYIKKKRAELSVHAEISTHELLTELKAITFGDISDYIGLSENEIKSLPPDKRRALKKVSIKERQYRYNDGTTATDITRTYEMHDKLRALESVAKHIGLYNADNQSKKTVINLTKLDVSTLNVLLKALE